MLVPRKDSETDRLVIDMTPLNKISLPVHHKAPRLEDVLTRASHNKFFSKIDIADAFWLIELTENCKYLTAFDTPWGTFEYNCLPQGWGPAPAYWQRYITFILQDLIYTCCFAMADDILVFGQTKEECHIRTRQVRARLGKAGIPENARKTMVCATSVTYFGHTLKHNQWRPVSNHNTIRDWRRPNNKRALQQWLGTINVFRDHIPNLSAIIAPMTFLTGDQKWTWTEAQDQSFHHSKRAALELMWRHPHHAGEVQELITDASDLGLGAILKEKGRVVSIISRKLTKHEQAYDTKHRECLAVVWATKILIHIISDAPTIIIHTDHANIVNALKASETSQRVNRWIDWLQNLHITWKHIRGEINPADGPSRQWDHKGSKTNKVLRE